MKKRILSLTTILSIIISLCPGVVSADVRTDGLIGYWTFDEVKSELNSEVNTDDWNSPPEYSGSVDDYQSGVMGNSYKLARNSGVIKLGNAPSSLANGALTISCWVKSTHSSKSTEQKIISIGNLARMSLYGSGGTGGGVYAEGSKAFSYNPNGSQSKYSPQMEIPNEKWYHVALTLTYTSSGSVTAKCYQDGVAEGRRTVAGCTLKTESIVGTAITLGGTSTSFAGYIDELRIYDKALSEDDIKALYDSYVVQPTSDKNEMTMYSYNKLSDDNYVNVNLEGKTYLDELDTSMFEVTGLPEGMEISEVERIDDTHAKVYFSQDTTDEIDEDVSFELKLSKTAVENSENYLDGEPIECKIKAPDKFEIAVTTSQEGNILNISGKVENTRNVSQSAAILYGVYDGNTLKQNNTPVFSEYAKDGYLEIAESIDVSGYTNPNVRVYVWDGLPTVSENAVSGTAGTLIECYSYPAADEKASAAADNINQLSTSLNAEAVTVSGKSDSERVNLIVYRPTYNDSQQIDVLCGVVDYFKEIPVNDNGSYAYTYTLNNPVSSVPYTVIAVDEEKSEFTTFEYYSQSYRETTFTDAKAIAEDETKTRQDFIDFVTANAYVLDIDLSAEGVLASLSPRGNDDFWTELEKNVNNLDSQSAFKQEVTKIAAEQKIVDDINAAATGTDLTTVIESENSTFGLTLNDDYQTYKETVALTMIDKEFHNIGEITSFFKNGLYVTLFNAIDFTDRDTMLNKLELYKTDLGISDTFFGENKLTYASFMMGITFTSQADITSKAAAAIVSGDAATPTPTPTPTPTRRPLGGGGGGGGGAGGVSTPVIGVLGNNVAATPTPLITAEEANAVFSDLESVSWAKEAIEALAEKNIVSGKGEKLFAPNDLVTRAEFAKMIVLAFGSYNENLSVDSFSDVNEDDWFYSYVANAAKRQVILGRDDGTFGYADTITRQDMCVMIYRQLEALGKSIELGDASFDDVDMISDYALDSVKALKSLGIINGVDANTFAPKSSCTRAMAAKVIYSALNLK